MPTQPPALLRHHRPFVAFWLARIFTASGFQMLTVAIGWNLYQLAGNVLDLGLVGLVEFAPRVLFMLHTGGMWRIGTIDARSPRFARRCRRSLPWP
ncbi:hypothetical protein SAMN05216605_11435 [Pseudomonas abietaniphila]|jgi:hypothetical protein|uniref:Transmembrane secretion effector n=1 Tax=Pseudomonas abietaniphila TaxID=89065 RepID=A0A1G8L4I5_9PSED|nr:hypothetical protein SAMN05216605_11435 [Pseudomonas abietaniphila]